MFRDGAEDPPAFRLLDAQRARQPPSKATDAVAVSARRRTATNSRGRVPSAPWTPPSTVQPTGDATIGGANGRGARRMARARAPHP
jgi:O-glycosyl hydrolase